MEAAMKTSSHVSIRLAILSIAALCSCSTDVGRQSAENLSARGTWSTLAPMPIEISEVTVRSEEHTSELQSRRDLVCRLLLEKKKNKQKREGEVVFDVKLDHVGVAIHTLVVVGCIRNLNARLHVLGDVGAVVGFCDYVHCALR